MKKLLVFVLIVCAALAEAQVTLKALPDFNQNSRIIYASAARTATPTAVTIDNPVNTGGMFVISVSAASATPSVVFTIDAYDSASAGYINILTSAAITGTGTTVLTIFPSATVTANVSVNRPLPRQLKVTATHGDSDSITYTVGAWFFP